MGGKVWCYRLYVAGEELVPWDILHRFLKDQWTVYYTDGGLRDSVEPSMVIEHITSDVGGRDLMRSLGAELKALWGQEAVLLTGHELSDFEII